MHGAVQVQDASHGGESLEGTEHMHHERLSSHCFEDLRQCLHISVPSLQLRSHLEQSDCCCMSCIDENSPGVRP